MSGDREMWAGGTAGLQSEVLYLAVELAGRIRPHDSTEQGRRLNEDDSFLREAAGRLGCNTAQIAAQNCHRVCIVCVRNRAADMIDSPPHQGGGVGGLPALRVADVTLRPAVLRKLALWLRVEAALAAGGTDAGGVGKDSDRK